MDNNTQLEVLITLIDENGFLSPQTWHSFDKVLNKGSISRPPAPLILGAWHYTNDEEKIQRLKEQVIWAGQNQKLAAAYEFLNKVPKNQWLKTY